MDPYERARKLADEVWDLALEAEDDDDSQALRSATALLRSVAFSMECRAKPSLASPGEAETALRNATGMDTWVVVRVEKDGVTVGDVPGTFDVASILENAFTDGDCEKVVILPTRGEWTHYTRLYEQTITSTNPLD